MKDPSAGTHSWQIANAQGTSPRKARLDKALYGVLSILLVEKRRAAGSIESREGGVILQELLCLRLCLLHPSHLGKGSGQHPPGLPQGRHLPEPLNRPFVIAGCIELGRRQDRQVPVGIIGIQAHCQSSGEGQRLGGQIETLLIDLLGPCRAEIHWEQRVSRTFRNP
jgi:hypothetical protein